MKIAIINTLDSSGGAAIAANRLARALKKRDIDVKLLVKKKQSDKSDSIPVNSTFFSKILSWLFFWREILRIIKSTKKISKKNLFSVSIADVGDDISKNKIIQDADVIHLHWINQGFLSLRGLKKLTMLGKPIVWTMHDQWPYTGICHYTGGCNNFTDTCSVCPMLKWKIKRDLSYKIFEKKKNIYKSNAFTFVGCSRWIADEAKRSNIYSEAKIVSIPNPIDTTIYNQHDKNEARKLLNLPLDKKLILFGACKVTDKRKGFEYMKASCDILYQQEQFSTEDLIIVIFGEEIKKIESLLPYHIHNAGFIREEQAMIRLYNAVDLFLVPSLEDNLPNTIMEAMSCGTPCVGFSTGGIPEMIDHKLNGYVAEYKNAEDLAKGIYWTLNEADYKDISTKAREKVVKNYSEDIVAKQYINLYKSL